MKRSLQFVAPILLASLCAAAQVPVSAKADAHNGRVDSAFGALGNARSADAEFLRCGLYSSIEDRDHAIQACEAATTAAPNNSTYELALARVYGDKADHSGAFTGMRMVGKIRGAFERAVQLDGSNVEALSDLGQFYVEAPGIVGGGTDKAKELATKLQPLSAARAHRLNAMIARKNHDDATAETEYKAALAAGHTPEAWVDLARYYRDRKQYDAAENAARSAIQIDKEHGPDTLDAAKLLLQLHRGVPIAQAGLRGYLATPQEHVAAYAQAHVLLGDSLKESGDTDGAQKEYAAALALAHNYEPARKAAGK
ncbi:tetratricopeptide repeat protein [Terriglobus sp. RCC_193]|uniref:tetratricopeptide repeat protein n=1 Tax=Terriglobus sp. RCC_193 TaxID=3239218 RepID=UPI003523CAED